MKKQVGIQRAAVTEKELKQILLDNASINDISKDDALKLIDQIKTNTINISDIVFDGFYVSKNTGDCVAKFNENLGIYADSPHAGVFLLDDNYNKVDNPIIYLKNGLFEFHDEFLNVPKKFHNKLLSEVIKHFKF